MIHRQVQRNMKEQQSPYAYLSRYRSELMGLAILWVVWFHSSFRFGGMAIAVTDFLKETGYGGVDIFLLVSGMGIYQSWTKHDAATFVRNRCKKILPVWWTYIPVVVLAETLLFGARYTKLEIVGFATFTGFWLDMKNQGNWYPYAIMFFYMISPLLVSLLQSSKNKTKTCAVLAGVFLAVSAAFVGNIKLIVFSRLPIYIVGMYVSAAWKDRAMDKRMWIACVLGCLTGTAALAFFYYRMHDLLWPYGLWWYPFLLIAPTLSLLIGKAFDLLHNETRPLRFLLRCFGRASLEILLCAVFVYKHPAVFTLPFVPESWAPLPVMLMGPVLGCIFHAAVECGKTCCQKMIRRFGVKKPCATEA